MPIQRQGEEGEREGLTTGSGCRKMSTQWRRALVVNGVDDLGLLRAQRSHLATRRDTAKWMAATALACASRNRSCARPEMVQALASSGHGGELESLRRKIGEEV